MRKAILAAAGAAMMLAGAAAQAAPVPTPAEMAKIVGAPAEPELYGPAATAREIVAVERAFAARAAEVGARTAFAEFMDATDSRAFDAGDPLRGATAIAASHATGTLQWAPSEVFASTGDMATDWGRWVFTAPGGVRVTGRFVTVWRKNADGKWKAIIDIGAPDHVQAKAPAG